MILTVLGSGTCVPSTQRNAPGYLLVAEGADVLLDCGSGILIQLEKAGKNFADIDAVFITHRHPDHFADLMPLVHALMAAPGCNRQRNLYIFGPDLFIKYYNAAIKPIFFGNRRFSVVPQEAAVKFDFGPFIITTVPTIHSDDSLAYRFECNGKVIVYTGDADYNENIKNLSANADLLIADCSFPARMKVKNHMSALECGILARDAGVKRLLLSHLYPADMPMQERVTEAASVFNGEIILAEDLMTINV